jgi:glycosyltransferase involved in cell wall biosynthesis
MHIFAYPSIWPETSCLAAIEAFSAGCMVVAPNYAGLTDTMARWGMSYQWHEDPNEHAKTFFQRLNMAIEQVRNRNSNNLNNYLTIQKSYFDNFYNWNNIKDQWAVLLKDLSNS